MLLHALDDSHSEREADLGEAIALFRDRDQGSLEGQPGIEHVFEGDV